jgi:hypothetical protein
MEVMQRTGDEPRFWVLLVSFHDRSDRRNVAEAVLMR